MTKYNTSKYMQEAVKPVTSHASIIGIFITLTIILSIPLFIFASNEKQDIRQRASAESNNIVTEGGYLRGYIYLDENQNGTREYNESGGGNISIEIAQTDKKSGDMEINNNILTTVISDANGYFRYDFAGIGANGAQNLNIDVLVNLPAGYKTINSNPVRFENISSGSDEILEIGIFAIQN